jgi:hypothetical protein
MRMRNRELSLLALLVAGVVLGGCGGGGDKSTTSNSKSNSKLQLIGGDPRGAVSPTKDRFLAEANRICLTGNGDISKAAEEAITNTQESPTIARLVQFGKRRALPMLQIELDQIKVLHTPAGDGARIKASIDQAQSDLDRLRANPLQFTLVNPVGPFLPTNRPAKRYGLVPCGPGP